jgi:hypothetical protein
MSPIVASIDKENAFVQVTNIGGFAIDLEDKFWNNMFEKELPRYKDRLDAIFRWPLLHTINVNTTSNHVFNNLYNCPINITYVVDSKSIPALALSSIIDNS